MNTGQIISGLGHVGLIAWAMLGGAFQSEPMPFEVTEVTAISAREYAALTAPETSPEAVANVDTPEPPAPGEAPGMVSEPDSAPELTQPEATETPPPDAVPEIVEPAPPTEAEVGEEPPVLAPPQEDTAALVPEVSPRPEARPAPRVAPEPVAQPEPDVRIDDVDRQDIAPDESAETVEQEQEETAREEAATEIVTEAEEAAEAAPTRSPRPRTRPDRSQPQPEEETETAGADDAPQIDDSAVEDAIAAALGGSETQPDSAPSGPPLTVGEKDALRVAVQECWNVGSLSTDALATTVVVAVRMFEDGRPDTDSIRMLDFSGGGAAAAERAYAAARRAIIRCGIDGYDLPPEKFDLWRDIEMTFNPENMRIR